MTWVWFLKIAEMLCRAWPILRGTESVSALTWALFILMHSLYIILFCQWWSSADRVVNLKKTIMIRFPLFWRTWTRARASTCPHVLAWHMGRDYSYCRASELTDSQVSGFVFSWFLENTEKTKASQETFLRLMPRTGTWSRASDKQKFSCWAQQQEKLDINFKMAL